MNEKKSDSNVMKTISEQENEDVRRQKERMDTEGNSDPKKNLNPSKKEEHEKDDGQIEYKDPEPSRTGQGEPDYRDPQRNPEVADNRVNSINRNN